MQSSLNGIVTLRSHDEVCRDKLGALVQQLEEGMLSISCWLSEDDGASGVLDIFPGAGNCFSVRLHRELLEICGESVKVLIERCNQMCLSSKKITVPNTQKTTKYRDILLQRGVCEVVIHSVGTSKEFVESVIANVESHTQPNSRPYRVSPANPLFETKHVLGVNTKFSNRFFIRRQGNKVLRDGGSIIVDCGLRKEPLLSCVGVRTCFGGGEGLGCNKEQGGLRITFTKSFGNVGTVDIRNEMKGQTAARVSLKSFSNHHRTPREPFC